VDQTGLEGRFDFRLEWTPDSAPAGEVRVIARGGGAAPAVLTPQPEVSDTPGPTFAEALREQLGLKLAASKGTIRTLVVDRVQRPSEN
jgi:uncharacterized protein (TIGR03435 family)